MTGVLTAWFKLASTAEPLLEHAPTALRSEDNHLFLYAIGGNDGNFHVKSTVERLNVSDSVETDRVCAPPPPNVVFGHAATVYVGRVFISGGKRLAVNDGDGRMVTEEQHTYWNINPYIIVNEVRSYDPVADAWQDETPQKIARYNRAAVAASPTVCTPSAAFRVEITT